MREMEGVGVFEEKLAVEAMDFHVGKFIDIERCGLLEGGAMCAEDGHGDGHELCLEECCTSLKDYSEDRERDSRDSKEDISSFNLMFSLF